ncbi:MAG: potassium channel family protein [Candidatus Aenigmarchaeota archaeon]|nr:potassium channel family protein [Candidatus Aenigmarchaeota archaeon]
MTKKSGKPSKAASSETISDIFENYAREKIQVPWELRIDTKIAAAVSAVAALLLFGTFVYHFMENWSWIQAFYFSVTTLTTVGYGDIHPTTDLSRLFTAGYILTGVAIVLASLEIIGSTYITRRETQILLKKQKYESERTKRKKQRQNL